MTEVASTLLTDDTKELLGILTQNVANETSQVSTCLQDQQESSRLPRILLHGVNFRYTVKHQPNEKHINQMKSTTRNTVASAEPVKKIATPASMFPVTCHED